MFSSEMKTANNEYAFFVHFKQHFIVVKKGQKGSTGELLGLCGNSESSSEPHLQHVKYMTKATSAKC